MFKKLLVYRIKINYLNCFYKYDLKQIFKNIIYNIIEIVLINIKRYIAKSVNIKREKIIFKINEHNIIIIKFKIYQLLLFFQISNPTISESISWTSEE